MGNRENEGERLNAETSGGVWSAGEAQGCGRRQWDLESKVWLDPTHLDPE